MKYQMIKDERNRSLMKYGTFSFPFASFWDDVGQYQDRVIDWHWHDELEFVYVLENSVSCYAGEARRELSAGEGIFINQNIIHRFETHTEGKMVSLVFSPHFIAAPHSDLFARYVEPVLSSAIYTCIFTPGTAWQEEILTDLKKISELIPQEGTCKDLDLYILLLLIWREFYTNGIEQKKQTKPDFIRTQTRIQCMLNYIEKNYQNEISVTDIAAAAHISSSEARRCFQKLMYKSPGKYLNEYRLSIAARLLCTTDKPISYVAYVIGFRSAAYFDRMFTRQYGMTPLQMRKEHTIDQKSGK